MNAEPQLPLQSTVMRGDVQRTRRVRQVLMLLVPLILVLAGAAAYPILLRLLGGAMGVATATFRHSSAAILRRIGLTSLASGGQDQTVRLWDVSSARERVILRGHGAEVAAVAFSPEGHILASAGWEPRLAINFPAAHRSHPLFANKIRKIGFRSSNAGIHFIENEDPAFAGLE